MSADNRYRDHVVVLFIAGLLALNYPLLAIANRLSLPFGIPLLYLYIFLLWFVLIIAMALISRRAKFIITESTTHPEAD